MNGEEKSVGPKTPPEVVAAVDLGSNSFHMIVSRLRNGELHVLDRLREMVRLAAGLDADDNLTAAARQRAIGCLERFGQRLKGMPPGSVRAVGTNTLRNARNPAAFLREARRALGHPIEIISGIEEARLVYLGVAHSLAASDARRLVIDIGGGSTEFIIGTGTCPAKKESLNMGCVSLSMTHFPDGRISAKRFKRAVLKAQQELEPFRTMFERGNWDEAVGASGTVRCIDAILRLTGWSSNGITAEGLKRLGDAMVTAGHVEQLNFSELNPERSPVFPGGAAILVAAFNALGIERMHVSEGALREGLLYDLVGRIFHEDIRSHSVKALAQRYHVNSEHCARIIETLRSLVRQVGLPAVIDPDDAMQWLEWAARLHEIGRDIAHHQYHKHGAYIIEHADLAGFSQQDQNLLATLVRFHRRKFSTKAFGELASPWGCAARSLAILLRLGVLLHRSRQTAPLPAFTIRLGESDVHLAFPLGWLEEHPLTQADLEQEGAYLKAAGVRLLVQNGSGQDLENADQPACNRN